MTEANWLVMAPWIKEAEGGFVNNPRDPGGATNYGVTLRTLQAWRKRPTTVADVKAMTWVEAAGILKAQYFYAVHGQELPPGLDYAVVDAAINSGPVQAVKWLQASLSIAVDGHYGLQTQQAVAGVNDLVGAIERFDKARLGFLQGLRTWPVFGKGWFKRVNMVTARAIGLAKEVKA